MNLRRNSIMKMFIYFMLAIGSFFTIMPFVWMISASLKLETEVFMFPIKWIPDVIRWENYFQVFEKIPFTRYYINTIIITGSVVILQIVTSSLAAYSFAKISYRGRDGLFLLYLSSLMIPFQVIMIPQFIIIKNLGLVNNIWSIVIISAFTPFGVFLFKQNFITIPEELSEAARIDGCSEFKIYLNVIMPLSKPAISSLAILTFVWTWNDFLKPLIYLSTDTKKTIQLGIRNFLSLYTADYALLMAAATMSLLPVIIVYFIAQKYFIEGMVSAGIKG